MKKGIIYLSVFSLVIILGGIIYFLLNNRQFKNNEGIKGIPINASIIIHVPDISGLSDLILNDIEYKDELRAFSLTSKVWNLVSELDSSEIFKSSAFKNIKQKDIYISFVLQGKENIETLLVTELDNRAEENAFAEWIKSFKNEGYSLETRDYDASVIYSVKKGEQKPFYVSAFQGLIIGSYSVLLVESSIRQIQSEISLLSNPSFEKIHKTSSHKSPANIYVNFSTFPGIFNKIFKDKQKQPPVFSKGEAMWAELDVDVGSKSVEMNGFIIGEKKNLLIELLARMRPQSSIIAEVLPSDTRIFMSYNPESGEELHKRLLSYLKDNGLEQKYRNSLNAIKKGSGIDIDKEFFSFLESEMALAFTDINSKDPYSSSLFVAETRGRSFTLDKMTNILTALKISASPVSVYKIDKDTSFPIYRGLPERLLERMMKWYFPHVPQKYFTLYDNYIVFADNIKPLQEFLYANVLKKTLANKKSFADLKENFSDRDNLFIYSEIPFLSRFLRFFLKGEYVDLSQMQIDKLSKFFAGGVQLASTGDLLYANIYANYNPSRENEPQTVWQSLLDSTVINKPVLVTNHYTKEKELMVQDAKFNLYLLNNSGRLLWKKPLDGRILGSIQQIDYYRNNKLQYIFNTKNKIYLLDRNGNFVENYPVSLPSKATNGLSVIDYDNNKSYRIFLAAEDGKVLLLDKRGNKVTGWEFKKTEGIVTQPVRHFRSSSKDYIVFSDNHKIYILNRRGRTRVKPDKHVHAASNCDIYLEGKNTLHSRLVTASPQGEVVTVDLPSGKTRVIKVLDKNREFGFTHFVQNGKPGYVFILPDKFMIFNAAGKKIAGKSFSSQMCLTIDKYRFSANDFKFGLLERNGAHIYLLNSDGSTYKGFPLRGGSRFSIGFLKTSSSRFNLVVGGDNNYIYNYRVD